MWMRGFDCLSVRGFLLAFGLVVLLLFAVHSRSILRALLSVL